MEEEYHTHHVHSSEWSEGSIILIVIVVIIIIILAVVFFLWEGNTPVNNNVTSPIWTTTTGNGASKDSFTADNFSIYKSASSTSGLALTLVPPTDPIGKQFIIDNTAGRGPIMLTVDGGSSQISTSLTISNNLIYNGTQPVTTNTVSKGKVSEFIWQSDSNLLRLY